MFPRNLRVTGPSSPPRGCQSVEAGSLQVHHSTEYQRGDLTKWPGWRGDKGVGWSWGWSWFKLLVEVGVDVGWSCWLKLVGWLVGWLVGRSVGRSVGWLVGWLLFFSCFFALFFFWILFYHAIIPYKTIGSMSTRTIEKSKCRRKQNHTCNIHGSYGDYDNMIGCLCLDTKNLWMPCFFPKRYRNTTNHPDWKKKTAQRLPKIRYRDDIMIWN